MLSSPLHYWVFYFSFLFFNKLCGKKLAFQLPTLRAFKSIDQSQSRLAGSGAISNCVESFCFLPFSCLSVSPKRRRSMTGGLCVGRGRMPSLHAWGAGLCDSKELIFTSSCEGRLCTGRGALIWSTKAVVSHGLTWCAVHPGNRCCWKNSSWKKDCQC